MRVCYLTEERISFSEAMVRGGAIHVRNVVDGLRARGHEVILVDWNDRPEQSFQRSITPRSRFVLGPLMTARQAISVGRRENVDVIVSKTRKTYLPGLIAARQLAVPHVVHVGSSLDRPLSGLADQLNVASFVTRLRAPHDGYFVVCNHIAGQLTARGIDRERIYDVKNAVDTDRFHPERIPTELDDTFTSRIDDTDDFRLGFVGGLQPYKGLDDLAAALEDVTASCTLLVAGDGPERDRLAQRFGDSATFLGAVPYEQVPALYHEFDAFVLPSHTEGLPRVILEAQATATPVVATRVGGVPEVIEHGKTGLLCEPGGTDALAAAIDRLGNNPDDRERIGTRGREAVVDSFSWDRMYDRYERYLGAVIEDR